MHWILILTLIAKDGVVIEALDSKFYHQDCKDAGEAWISSLKRPTVGAFLPSYVCVSVR